MSKKIIISAIATIVMIVVMQWQGKELQSKYSPAGIMSLELAEKFQDATDIVDQIGKTPLRVNITLDFVFIIAYGCLFFFCCWALMNNYRSKGMKTMGFIFLELSVLTAVLDIVENITMLITIAGHGSEVAVLITKWVAYVKFGLAALTLVYIVTAFVLVQLLKRKQ